MRHVGLVGLLLVVLSSGTGCGLYRFDLDSDEGPPPLRRTNLRSGGEKTTFPGVKVTWAVLPKVDNAPLGLTTPGAIKEWSPLFMPKPPAAPLPPMIWSEEEGAGGTDESGGAGPAASSESASSAPPDAPQRLFRRAVHTLSFDIDYAAAVGIHGGDTLNARERIDFKGDRTNGPAFIRYRYDTHVGSISLRTGGRFAEFFSLEALAGFSVASAALKVRTDSAVRTETVNAYGGHLGTRMTFTPHRLLDVYLQFKAHLMDTQRAGERYAEMIAFETGTKIHLTPNIAGYAAWRIQSYRRNVDDASNLSLSSLSGASLGVQLRF